MLFCLNLCNQLVSRLFLTTLLSLFHSIKITTSINITSIHLIPSINKIMQKLILPITPSHRLLTGIPILHKFLLILLGIPPTHPDRSITPIRLQHIRRPRIAIIELIIKMYLIWKYISMMIHLPRILKDQSTRPNPSLQINPPRKIRLLDLHRILLILRFYLLLLTLTLYRLLKLPRKASLNHPLHIVEIAIEMVTRYLIPCRKVLVACQSGCGESDDLIVEAVPALVVDQDCCDLVCVCLDRVVVVDVHYLTFAPDHLGIPDVQQIADFKAVDRGSTDLKLL